MKQSTTLVLAAAVVLLTAVVVVQRFELSGSSGASAHSTTVTVSATGDQVQYAKLNITRVTCDSSKQSCTIELLNYGVIEAHVLACVYAQSGGGVGELNGTLIVPAGVSQSVLCYAPPGMPGISPGAKGLGALYLLRSAPISWTCVWG